ncbi:MFS transporter [Halopenitus sp. H-Gu1]|uniref:MFS transporter n=1 Tax=Halopenitus sp. H-Gu1 TaxID=3242697 RepID=UPI00359DBB82
MEQWPPDGRRSTLVALTGGNFAQFGVRLLLGAVVPLVLTDLGTTKSRIGLALTGMWAVYALFQFPSGILADRFGERPLLLVGLSGTVVGAALVSITPSIRLYGIFVVVLGAGAGLFYSPASALISRLYQEHGGALGMLTASGAVAGVVYPIGGSYLAARFGWRFSVAVGAAVALPALLMTLGLVSSLPPANSSRSLRDAVDVQQIRELLSRPSVAYTTIIAIITAFTFQAIGSFFPTFLVEFRGVEPSLAGVGFGAVFGISAIAQPVAGLVSDYVSRDFAIGSSVTLTGLAFLILIFVPSNLGLVAGTALLGVGVSWPGTTQARFMDQLDDAERGYGFGLVRTVYMFVGASGSVVVGTLAEQFGWPVSYGAVVALLSVCVLLLASNRIFGLDL